MFSRRLPQAAFPEIAHTTPKRQGSKEIAVMEGMRVSPVEVGSEILKHGSTWNHQRRERVLDSSLWKV